MIVLIILMFCFIIYLVFDELDLMLAIQAKRVKKGDVYLWKYHKYGDPFNNPTLRYAIIIEVRMNDNCEYWVQYQDGLGSDIVKTMDLRTFLKNYKLSSIL